MINPDFPFIVVELVMTLGGALAFGWWQMRDLKNERQEA
jgi:DNA-binding transcriptional regulator of glucitol operon